MCEKRLEELGLRGHDTSSIEPVRYEQKKHKQQDSLLIPYTDEAGNPCVSIFCVRILAAPMGRGCKGPYNKYLIPFLGFVIPALAMRC